MKKYTIIAVFCILGLLGVALQACIVEITNDGRKDVLIVAQDDTSAVLIAPGQVQTFGDKTEHANFTLMIRTGKGNFKCKKMVKQFSCSASTASVPLSAKELMSGRLRPEIQGMFNVFSCKSKKDTPQPGIDVPFKSPVVAPPAKKGKGKKDQPFVDTYAKDSKKKKSETKKTKTSGDQEEFVMAQLPPLTVEEPIDYSYISEYEY